MKTISVIFTGGTIGSITENGVIHTAEGVARELMNDYRHYFADDTVFRVSSPAEVLSENLTPEDWQRFYEAALAASANCDGILMTHGSDTLAYTAAYLSMVWNKEIPLVLVASSTPLSSPGSDGWEHFRSGVTLLRRPQLRGVYTVWHMEGSTQVFLGSRVVSAAVVSDDFSGIEGRAFGEIRNGRLVRYRHPGNPSFASLAKRCPVKETKPAGGIVMMTAYPGLRYEDVILPKGTKAVLHRLYHSDTACTKEGAYSLAAFIRRCKEVGVDSYLLCYRPADAVPYETTAALLEAGAQPMRLISAEAAYVKLQLAYAQQEMSPGEFIKQNIWFEHF